MCFSAFYPESAPDCEVRAVSFVATLLSFTSVNDPLAGSAGRDYRAQLKEYGYPTLLYVWYYHFWIGEIR